MNKKLIYGVVLLAIVQLGKGQAFDPNTISDAFNAYDGNFSSSGTARYIGMGESMGALGGDISAVETNPAGLGVFRNSVANMTFGVLSNKNKASMANSYSNTDTNFNFSNAGFAIAFGDESDPLRFNMGVNYSYQRLDNEVVFPYNTGYQYSIGGEDFDFNSYEQYTDGYKSKLKFSFATNYEDKIYFGLGLDWHYLNMDRSDIYSDRMLSDNSVGYFSRQGTPYYQDANGFGLSVGVIGKVIPEVRLGAAYHSPIWWSDINTDYNYFVTQDNNGNLDWDIYYGYYDKYKITAPGKVVLSAAYASNIVNDDNSLAVNFDFINYFNKDYEFKGSSDYRLNNTFVDSYMRNSQEYRAGVEYRFREFKLRAGYAYASSPVKDNSIQGFNYESNQDNVTVKNYMAGEKNKFSFGLGYDLGLFFVDFAYQFIKTDYYTTFSGAYYNNTELRDFDAIFDTPTFGKVKNTQNNFVLTLGMRF